MTGENFFLLPLNTEAFFCMHLKQKIADICSVNKL